MTGGLLFSVSSALTERRYSRKRCAIYFCNAALARVTIVLAISGL
jgi:hypothetical protein